MDYQTKRVAIAAIPMGLYATAVLYTTFGRLPPAKRKATNRALTWVAVGWLSSNAIAAGQSLLAIKQLESLGYTREQIVARAGWQSGQSMGLAPGQTTVMGHLGY